MEGPFAVASEADRSDQWVRSEHHAVSILRSMFQASHMERSSLVIRGLWAGCLLIGGLNHARTLLQHGFFWDYGYSGINPISVAYWTGLTILDPLVAALLFVRPRWGIPATIVLIVTNVIHNLATIAHYAPVGEFLARTLSPISLSQISFMLFVLFTVRIAWVGLPKRRTSAMSRKRTRPLT